MKKLILLLTICILASCESTKSEDYTDISTREFNTLKSPVILIGKEKSLGCYNITVIDSNKTILCIGNMSIIARTIGESRNIGDTLK